MEYLVVGTFVYLFAPKLLSISKKAVSLQQNRGMDEHVTDHQDQNFTSYYPGTQGVMNQPIGNEDYQVNKPPQQNQYFNNLLSYNKDEIPTNPDDPQNENSLMGRGKQ